MDKYVKIEDAAKAFSFYTPYCYDDCLNDLRSSILNGFIHSSDVVPVVHAKWIGKPIAGYCNIRCSVCDEIYYNNGKWKYCPTCGAKMDLADD